MIIHISGDCKGGTEKYINDLITLYSNYTHTIIRTIPFTITNINDIELIHIHSVFFESNINWEILNVINQIKTVLKNVQIYLTIHDYQWLFDNKPFYTIENREDALKYYQTHNKSYTSQLFDKVDHIFIPTQRVFDNYKYFMSNDLTLTHMNKMHIIPHSDIVIRNEQLYVPPIQSKTLHIGFVGTFNEYKGGRLFLDLIYNLLTYKNYKIEYHIFGNHSPSENDDNLKHYVHFHGSYKDITLIQKLYDNNVHILTSFSLLEETYCYALSLLINSGLPIVYLNRGALMTRLSCNYPRLFPIENVFYKNIESIIIKAIEYVIDNQDRKDLITLSNELILNNEYKNLYLKED